MLNILSAKALVLLAAAAFFSAAQSSERADPKVTILAEKQDLLTDGVVHAEGSVSLTSQDLRIDADEIDFAPSSADGPEVRAHGNVVLRRDGDVFRCSELRLELTTGRGEFRLR